MDAQKPSGLVRTLFLLLLNKKLIIKYPFLSVHHPICGCSTEWLTVFPNNSQLAFLTTTAAISLTMPPEGFGEMYYANF